MSNKLKIFIGVFSGLFYTAGLVLVITGVLLGASNTVYITNAGVKSYKLTELKNESYTPEELNNISIKSPNTNIRIFTSTSIKVETEYFEEITTNEVITENGDLTINQTNKYLFKFDLIPSSTKENINIMVPQDYVINELNIDIKVGKISIKDVKINNISINSSVSEVNIENAVIGNITTDISVGDVAIKKSEVKSINIDHSVSNVQLEDLTNLDTLKVDVTNGKVRVYKVDSLDIDIKTVNAEVTISNSAIERISSKVKVKSTNGKVSVNAKATEVDVELVNGALSFNSVKADRIRAKTVNGNIKGSLFTIAESSSFETVNGLIDVRGRFSKDVFVKTTNGNIDFRSTAGTAIKYNFDLSTTNGKLTLNDKLLNNKSYTYENAANTNMLTVKSTNGSINVVARGNE